MGFFAELKRRNVIRVGIGYAILTWLLLQVTDVVVPILELPTWVAKLILFLLMIGFPLALFLAWAFELTPEGFRREHKVDRTQPITHAAGRKLDYAIIAILAIALSWFVWDKFKPIAEPLATDSDEVRVEPATGHAGPREEKKSIAVLPFVAMSQGADDEYFADGLTEEILNSLAQLPELLVTARTSSFHFKGMDLKIPDIAAQLGVQHIVEGSVRRSGDRLRVTAQLVRAADGFHVWSENYDSTAEDTIQVQQDIAEKIALAMDVVLDDTKREAMRASGLRDVEAFITMQKANKLFEEAHGDADLIPTLRAANALYEQVIRRVPDYARAHVEHSDLYVHLLNDNATFDLSEEVTEQDIAEAKSQAQSDMSAALSSARNFSEQNNLEIDLSFLTGNWRGIGGRLQRFSEDSGCDEPNWSLAFALPFGEAAKFVSRLEEFVVCDPLSSQNWFDETRAHLWAGNLQEALRVAQKGMKVAPGDWLRFSLLWTLAANGEFEEMDHVIDANMQKKREQRIARIFKYAAMGEADTLNRLIDEDEADSTAGGFFKTQYYAWSGRREDSNRLAASIDQRAFGPQALILSVFWCMCGAPFDLQSTPNFAAKIEEADLAWPPRSPIEWPLKTW